MLVIALVGRGPPLVGGTMTYSAYGGLTIPYIYIGGDVFHRPPPPTGFPIEAYRGPMGEYGVYTGVPTYALRRRPAGV